MKKIILLLSITFLFALDFPKLTGRVVDNANLLSPQTKQYLEKRIKEFENNTSNQLVVVTLNSLEGVPIEEYGYKLGRYWGIGEKGKDNGVLLIIAPNERKVRIEVGYGLEGNLTDAKSFMIINDNILPYFKNGNYDEGVKKGVDAIINTLSTQKKEQEFTIWDIIIAMVGLIVLGFGTLGFFMLFLLPSVIVGGISFIICYTFYPQNLTIGVIITLILAILAFIATLIYSFKKGVFDSSKTSSKSTSTKSSSTKNTSSSTKSSSSSFKGKGGSFGGGGSSGSW